MKKYIISISMFALAGAMAYGQGAIDAYSLSQPDLKGTARFMGMAGAFGALGGDLSTLSQNPAGIGVYRSNDIGFTLDLDLQNSASHADGQHYNVDNTHFLLNNIGTVLTLKLPSQSVPNLNFGFTYNKAVSFNRTYGGNISTLYNSMSNYFAGIANDPDGSGLALSEDEIASTNNYDPYNPGYGEYAPPWAAILGYDSYLITPQTDMEGNTRWYGLWSDGMTGSTSGSGSFYVKERGAVNEFNIAFGGNFANKLYWGMNFDIINLNYSLDTFWAENLANAMVPGADNQLVKESAEWNINNIYNVSGTGFNYQLGLIFKPVQEFRLGFAFHTPTWYNLNESFGADVNYLYGGTQSGSATTNGGILGYNSYSFRTPWKLMASAAGVIGNNFILSMDYEWANYGKMHFSDGPYFNDYDYGYDDWWPYSASQGPVAYSNFVNPNDPYGYENSDIATYYKTSNTLRLGAEFKPTSNFSIRAGYSFVSSPVKNAVKDNKETIYTAGTNPSYRFDNDTYYITGGIGYRYSHFYIDLAYVYKHMDSKFHAYTPDPSYPNIPSPQSNLSFSNNQVVLSAGYRF